MAQLHFTLLRKKGIFPSVSYSLQNYKVTYNNRLTEIWLQIIISQFMLSALAEVVKQRELYGNW